VKYAGVKAKLMEELLAKGTIDGEPAEFVDIMDGPEIERRRWQVDRHITRRRDSAAAGGGDLDQAGHDPLHEGKALGPGGFEPAAGDLHVLGGAQGQRRMRGRFVLSTARGQPSESARDLGRLTSAGWGSDFFRCGVRKMARWGKMDKNSGKVLCVWWVNI
jgi:hypothetical protein